MKRIILSVTNDLATDQRIERIASTLYRQGAKITLVGRKRPDSLPLNRPYPTHRMKLLFNKKVFFYAEYNIRLFFYLLVKRADILVSNDLDTLPANFLVSVLRRKILVYDSHEYFTGMPEIQDRKLVHTIWKSFERIIFPRLKHIYTVNRSIAELYSYEYGKEVQVVRNVPKRLVRNEWPQRKDLDLPEDKKIVLIQGAGINMHRGAEETVQAMQYLGNFILLIIGGGDVISKLKEMVFHLHLNNKVIFRDKMPYEQLMTHTRLADIGLSLDKNTNINYMFSLPNKLFDYIQAGIPVLCSNLPEVAGIVLEWDIGTIAENHDPHYLAEKINDMVRDESRYLQWKQNLSRAAADLCWEKEEKQLLNIYKNLL